MNLKGLLSNGILLAGETINSTEREFPLQFSPTLWGSTASCYIRRLSKKGQEESGGMT